MKLRRPISRICALLSIALILALYAIPVTYNFEHGQWQAKEAYAADSGSDKKAPPPVDDEITPPVDNEVIPPVDDDTMPPVDDDAMPPIDDGTMPPGEVDE